MTTIIAIVIAIIVLSYTISKRNRFESLKKGIRSEGANIGIYVDKRSACLNDLLDIADVNYRNEVEGIKSLTEKDQLNQLMFLGEKYPELKTTAAYAEQMRQASILQSDIASARVLLNGNIQNYNDEISQFPALIVAKIFGYKEEKFIDEDSIEENKTLKKAEVDFSKYRR